MEPPSAPRPLRILEVGGDHLFKRGAPDQTDHAWTSFKPSPSGDRALGPLRLLRCLSDLRAGRYDLVVVHANQYAPWSARSLAYGLRDWGWRAPLGLFAMFAWRLVCIGHRTPVAAVDLGDSFGVGRHNFFLLRAARAYFKRELPTDHWQVFHHSGHGDLPGRRWRLKARTRGWIAKLQPISYGALDWIEPRPPGRKTADVFFAGAIDGNSTSRILGLTDLRQLADEGFDVDIPDERLARDAFMQRMAGAWLAWSPAGLGWDCRRHYEAPLVGTVPVMSYPSIRRDRPLREGEHCLLYDPQPGALADVIRAALADKPRLTRMARAAEAHVREHHSDRARAEHVAVTVLGRRLDGTVVPAASTARRDDPMDDQAVDLELAEAGAPYGQPPDRHRAHREGADGQRAQR